MLSTGVIVICVVLSQIMLEGPEKAERNFKLSAMNVKTASQFQTLHINHSALRSSNIRLGKQEEKQGSK